MFAERLGNPALLPKVLDLLVDIVAAGLTQRKRNDPLMNASPKKDGITGWPLDPPSMEHQLEAFMCSHGTCCGAGERPSAIHNGHVL